MHSRRILPAMLAAAALFLGGCALKDAVSPYRVDVRQGNFVTPEMVGRLKTGMSREQVRFVLGTPLVVDPFHADRWDYVYRFQPGRGKVEQRKLTVFFRDGVLAEMRGDIPAEDASASAPATRVIEISGPVKDR